MSIRAWLPFSLHHASQLRGVEGLKLVLILVTASSYLLIKKSATRFTTNKHCADIRHYGQRCANYDGSREWTTQPDVEACFEHCNAVRGRCSTVSFSDSSENACLFSGNSSNTSCAIESWLGYSTYTRTCHGAHDHAGALEHHNLRQGTKTKHILLYSSLFWNSGWDGMDPSSHMRHCPVPRCSISMKPELPPTHYDALVFHTPDVGTSGVPAQRHARQRYVLFGLESPLSRYGNGVVDPAYSGIFNWTMTYRRGSDIFYPYGAVVPKNATTLTWGLFPKDPWIGFDKEAFLSSLPHQSQRFRDLANRPRRAVWVVSNCGSSSGREAYVAELKKHMQVDVWGRCGTKSCGADCMKTLDEQHTFYLAFENAFCDDYVTEKFFRTLTLNLVPIVMGGADYTFYAPPHSYINVKDFEGPRHLALFLRTLSAADYLSYFWWKDRYEVRNSRWPPDLCRLCQMLHNTSIGPKTNGDIGSVHSRAACRLGRAHRTPTLPPHRANSTT